MAEVCCEGQVHDPRRRKGALPVLFGGNVSEAAPDIGCVYEARDSEGATYR